MKCIVTGGSGFIGSHLVRKLLEEGHEVTVLDLRPPVEDVKWIKHDVREPLDTLVNGADFVFHLAAVANARKSGQDPRLCFETNVLGTVNVLQGALKSNVARVILASSSWVGGAQHGETVNEASLFRLPDVNTVYGAAKLSQELLCYSFVGEFGGPKYTILRYGVPYGERMWKGLVIRAFMDMAERAGTISVMGDGKQYREFLYVGDMCDAQVLAMRPVAENKVYNLTGNRPISVEELAKEVVKHFPAEIEYIPQARVEPKLKRIQNWLAESELGWVPMTSLEDGIARCAQWWRSLTPEEKREEYWC